MIDIKTPSKMAKKLYRVKIFCHFFQSWNKSGYLYNNLIKILAKLDTKHSIGFYIFNNYELCRFCTKCDMTT